MEVVRNVALISINGTLLVQLGSFLIFLFLINRLMFRPLRRVMDERKERVHGAGEQVAAMKEQLEELKRELDRRELAGRKEAASLQNAREKEGAVEADATMAAVLAEIERLKDRAAERIQREMAEARESMEKESQTLCVHIMEKVLDRRLAG